MTRNLNKKENTTTNIMILFLIILTIVSFFTRKEEIFAYFDNGRTKVNITEKGDLQSVAKNFTIGCKDKDCIAMNTFEYIKNIPYVRGSGNKDPKEVIFKNGGDCDERSYLFASLLNENDISNIVIYTKNHAFSAVEIKDEKKMNIRPLAYIEIENKKYYYAETTNPNGYIGSDNNIKKKDIIGIYNTEKKKQINLNGIKEKIIY